jgi:hypothetical protein
MAIVLFLSLIPLHSMAEERPISINFWPLFHYTSDLEEGVSKVEGLGPFLYWKRDSDRREWGFRPLFFWTGDESDSLWRLEFLYPFGKFQVKENEKKGYLFPLSAYREEEFDGKKKWDFQFFPFLMGETEKEEDYVGLFPLFGTLLGKYGKEEIRFYLWPLYSRSTSEGFRTTNVLWPFFSFIEGEKKRGYRFWPIYGRREEFGVSKSEFFLWPIFLRKKKGLDTEDPIDERMIFPFYLSKESKHFRSRTYLWPFFSHARDRLTGFEQWDLPWPLFRTLKGENLYGIRIFILYGYKVREGESKRVSFLYPLYRYEEDRMGDIQERTYRILFSRIRISEDDQGRERERSFRIWPFFDYEREETGRETFSIFYLLPFKEEGLERNLFPLFRIFRWEKDPQGATSANLFWGLYKKVKKEELDYWEIAHLIGLKRGDGWKKVSVLKGLLLYKREGETTDLRLFYLPFHVRWSQHNSTTSSLGEGRCEKAEGIFFQPQGETENFTPAERELADGR